MTGQTRYRRHWRDYKTAAGRRPVVEFLDSLKEKHLDHDVVAILKSMRRVSNLGPSAARHLRGDIYEVRAQGFNSIYRVLFAIEGRYSQVLLSLDAFSKKTAKAPSDKIKLAEQRLRDWRIRGRTRGPKKTT